MPKKKVPSMKRTRTTFHIDNANKKYIKEISELTGDDYSYLLKEFENMYSRIVRQAGESLVITHKKLYDVGVKRWYGRDSKGGKIKEEKVTMKDGTQHAFRYKEGVPNIKIDAKIPADAKFYRPLYTQKGNKVIIESYAEPIPYMTSSLKNWANNHLHEPDPRPDIAKINGFNGAGDIEDLKLWYPFKVGVVGLPLLFRKKPLFKGNAIYNKRYKAWRNKGIVQKYPLEKYLLNRYYKRQGAKTFNKIFTPSYNK